MTVVPQRHPEGVASIGFKEVESAAACAQAMNRRWYGGRQLEVQVWDGVTNYQVSSTLNRGLESNSGQEL